jgi:hypothetical protein
MAAALKANASTIARLSASFSGSAHSRPSVTDGAFADSRKKDRMLPEGLTYVASWVSSEAEWHLHRTRVLRDAAAVDAGPTAAVTCRTAS